MKKINLYTHNGIAHRDDFLSSCVILATYDVAKIYRKPSQWFGSISKEPDDQNFWFDVGGDVDPVKRIFDHHQVKQPFDKPECALSLVLQYITGLSYKDLIEFCPTLDFTIRLDCFGPVNAFKQCVAVEAKAQPLMQSMSPVESFLLEQFQAKEEHDASSELCQLMAQMGKDMLAKIYELQNFKKVLKDKIKFINNIAIYDGVILRNASAMLDVYIQKHCPKCIIKVSRSSQDPKSWCAIRTNEKLDFNKMLNPKTTFIHPNGFFCVWKNTESLEVVLDDIESLNY